LLVKSSGISDVGLRRDGNEDSFSVEDSLGLYVVADGMGGHLAGEVASRICIEIINKTFQKWIKDEASEEEIFGRPDSSLSLEGNYIRSSIRLANRVVYELASEQEQYHGMGTTVAVLFVTPSLIIAANVGDSRIYLIRDGEIERLSKDHSIVAEQVEMGIMTEEEAANSSMKHILTRSLGSSENVEPDIFEIEPTNNDYFIICSDGLTDLVGDEEILEMAQKENEPEHLCREFILKVLKRGAYDNTTIISLILMDIKKAHEGPLKNIGFFISDLFIDIQKAFKKIIP